MRVLLYDNSPGGSRMRELPEGVIYRAASGNQGLAAAYNYALGLADQEGGFDWLLTLDQDSRLPADFLKRIVPIAIRLRDDGGAGAIVPHLRQGNRVLSPVQIVPWGVRYLPLATEGFGRGEVHAFNSGSLFRRGALQQIGGFDERFWLDYQDASIFRRLYRHGKRIYIAQGLNIEHQLSLISEKPMSVARMTNYLSAESAFCDMHRGRLAGLMLTARMAGRVWKLQRRGGDRVIQRLMRRNLLRRLLHSRRSRIEEWSGEMRDRLRNSSGAGKVRSRDERPRISVCMAAYNGERYITAQLESILSQLAPDDEVVIVDDHSTDQTRDRVLSVRDSRIHLVEHSANRGVLRTFEDALRAASGKILFLSDQDDIWEPRKVPVILEAFRTHPEVSLVTTDNALIDSDGSLLSRSYFANRGEFKPGLIANLIRNRYGGCTMAFRAEILGDVLPLPHGYDVLHDIWIGVRGSLSGHRALYIRDALVRNRRHSATATGRKPLSAWRRIRIRIHLLLALGRFQIRKVFALNESCSAPEV